MIRRNYELPPYSELYWVLDGKRFNRCGRFEPLIPRRDAHILSERKRALHNKHTVGTA